MNEIYRCRIDGSPLTSVWNLGDIKPSNFVRTEDEDKRVLPLHIVKGKALQLKHEIDFKKTYSQYWYTSGLNSSMVYSLKDIANDIKKFIFLRNGDVVVDIGSNDSTLLGFFPKKTYRIGFEPAKNINSNVNCDMLIPDFFDASLFPSYLKAKVVTTIAMFYDVPDPISFANQVRSILDKDGIWVLQLTDLSSMLRANAFDNICHEHLFYYSVDDLRYIVESAGLQIIKISHNKVNGGSIRLFIGHPNVRTQLPSVGISLQYEEMDTIEDMRDRVDSIKEIIMDFLHKEIVLSGKDVMVSGASTKGNTLVQYFGIDDTLIPYAAEVNPQKFGLLMSGSNIKIIPEHEAIKMKPHYFFILPWHFEDTFINKYHKYIRKGGSLIFPLPEPRIFNKEGWWKLG